MSSPALPTFMALAKPSLLRVDEVILRCVEDVQEDVPLISQITSHIVHSGGKRLRPSLTLICAHLLGYSGMRHINLAATVELIHTATLLHDDVVDESTMRRGQETANSLWSNQASVLVGDFLLSRAFQLMVADGSLDVLKLLSDASATIAQGEVKQLVATGNLNTDTEHYVSILYAKTAALFSAACEIAGILTENAQQQTALRDFGYDLGIAFQLVDDALDYSATQATLGKTIGDDLRESKVTLPIIHAYRHASTTERAFWDRVIGEGDCREEDLATAIEIIASHKAIEHTMQLAQDYCDKAAAQLTRIDGDMHAKKALLECLNFCTSRKV